MAAHPIVIAKRRRVIEALAEGRPKTEIATGEQISRKTVRRWQARHEEHGDDWLMDRVPRRLPAMPNQTPLEVELVIVDHALAHPEAGPRTIAAALRAEHGVGVTAVYGTLKRRGLETRAKRLAEVHRRAGQTELDAVERDRALSKMRHLKAPVPGHIVCADTALVGRLKKRVLSIWRWPLTGTPATAQPSLPPPATPRWRPPAWSACTGSLPPRVSPGSAGR